LRLKFLLQPSQCGSRFLQVTPRDFPIAQSLPRISPRALIQSPRILERALGLRKRFFEALSDMLSGFARALRRLERTLRLR
jgi:hypothetical protein